MTDLRTAAQQALEYLDAPPAKLWPAGTHERIIAALRAALAQQAESDHETRAELAEQQVVQLAEERDHYRNLWQKAQQAAPEKRRLELWAGGGGGGTQGRAEIVTLPRHSEPNADGEKT